MREKSRQGREGRREGGKEGMVDLKMEPQQVPELTPFFVSINARHIHS
jgi:hypothetical protein